MSCTTRSYIPRPKDPTMKIRPLTVAAVLVAATIAFAPAAAHADTIEPPDVVAQIPVDETPAEESPADEPLDETPVDESPTEEPPAEEEPVDPPAPDPIRVETAPPAPTFTDPCGRDNVQVTLPADAGPWLYYIHRDPVGGTGYVGAYLPEGYVIGDTGYRYWWPVFEFRDSQLPCPPDEVPPPVVDVEPVEPIAPAVPVSAPMLAETGPGDMTGIAALAGLGALVIGLGLFFLNHRARRAR